VIDSLDTLWIMGLSDQYSRARNWVDKNLHFKKNFDASVFETTIRVMGGLMAGPLHPSLGTSPYSQCCRDVS
jgi:hypothetical protein